MKPSDKIVEFIKQQEGFRARAYKPLPTDRWTYGYGSTYKLDGTRVQEGDTISEEEATEILTISLDKLGNSLNQYLAPAKRTFSDQDQQEFDAVLSLIYNIGLKAFLSSETGKAFLAGECIYSSFPKWVYSGGSICAGLVARRKREQKIYMEGSYT